MTHCGWKFQHYLAFCLLLFIPFPVHGAERDEVLSTMKRATVFMVERVSHEGGYVWNYLPGLSRRWGEMEAYPTMIWIQPPGTPGMGEVFLEAYRATCDEYYYEAACRAADALVRAQHPSGGWNYLADFAGDASLRQWYDTIGRNGWRLEEFQEYADNATFDDHTTTAAALFLLHLHLEKREPKHKASLDKAIQFVLNAQYPSGGWPQRYPPVASSSTDAQPHYSTCITFNDDVAVANINFLMECERVLGDERLREPIRRAMQSFVASQQAPPQAGWAMQYTPDLEPAGARSYEPKALCTSATAQNIAQLIRFYRLTGDTNFLTRIPEALDWLDSVKFPADRAEVPGTHPTFVELGSNKSLFIHRSGSNVRNGRYYADHNPADTIGHYSSFRTLNVDRLRERYRAARTTPPGQTNSDLSVDVLQDWRTPSGLENRRRARRSDPGSQPFETPVEHVIRSLNPAGYWPSQLWFTSHPYQDRQPVLASDDRTMNAFVGDESDTSPYRNPENTPCIAVSTYISNMRTLIRDLGRSHQP